MPFRYAPPRAPRQTTPIDTEISRELESLSLSPKSSSRRGSHGHQSQTSSRSQMNSHSQVSQSKNRRSRSNPTTSNGSNHKPPTPKKPSPQPPKLKAKDVLKNPRVQQVTGLLPAKVSLWNDRELPPAELYRLAWAVTLPEPFPRKRPRGNF
ncbi:hypothetical protein GGR57DRAFT_267024 [Xylariaceae sp. FL1272]|nr:hypothetical protein GGR57DRAFT_267024 [Xylariaceae sp. FL1272]